MTPYATLLVSQRDTDEVIRARFHALSRVEHPDRDGANGLPGPLWYAITTAYAAVKTEEKRGEWYRMLCTLSGVCTTCLGFGVTGTRRFGGSIKVCAECEGEGRTRVIAPNAYSQKAAWDRSRRRA